MRTAQKKQLEDFMELLEQAQDEIKNAIEQKKIENALRLLGDCQEGAISVGNLIEKTEGEDAAAIQLIEDYCELVYQIHEKLSEGAGINVTKIYKLLRQSFFKINHEIRHNIKVRREVVFLPYKASMWDSLESVWQAADDDPDCDAFVIPIPYYDRKSDGSFDVLHYEADLYPDYVPVTKYENYDFENRKPDMIFIHSPYDDCNYVTSVPPFFYSKNLKRFTDCLVYVPYFILSEIDPENQREVKGMEHFCTVPGVMNADKVVVQSEDMRKIYVNVLTEAAGTDSRKYWEDKILGLGSPKIDKILGTKKEELKIPEEWRKIIQKPDGSRKKIILYNTSVSALLHYGEAMLEKMKSVFDIFYKNREDVAFFWRPHPLIEATIKSMRPGLWADYQQLVNRYLADGWGIYDDTPNIDRAILLSDAYYGDRSSVIQLCQKIGLPIMIQNVEM
ncbi:hypothetical protein EBB54_27395 [Schaedlerella arabinosiphila]|jgi:hypothetical protein|uniref:CDP-Glycerol:Poly(Glycerophosphate) glycerophosphotransferase n=1 Tax=Schaedlerella arabinosiphila TaxID=2044587 RepID=A0A3R8L1S1_9FIRM|nr:hypothetical protein [Schaedlerella arabinosiphila]RRK34647.1 hypothetical protein EBB54_27395 [Schaedlerella arabinosiphila]